MDGKFEFCGFTVLDRGQRSELRFVSSHENRHFPFRRLISKAVESTAGVDFIDVQVEYHDDHDERFDQVIVTIKCDDPKIGLHQLGIGLETLSLISPIRHVASTEDAIGMINRLAVTPHSEGVAMQVGRWLIDSIKTGMEDPYSDLNHRVRHFHKVARRKAMIRFRHLTKVFPELKFAS